MKDLEEYSRAQRYRILRLLNEADNGKDADTDTSQDDRDSTTSGSGNPSSSETSDSSPGNDVDIAGSADSFAQEIAQSRRDMSSRVSTGNHFENEISSSSSSGETDESSVESDTENRKISKDQESTESGDESSSDSGSSSSDDSSGTSEESQGKEDPDQFSTPLYAGAPLTLGESLMTILMLMVRHSITGTCLADVLTLIGLHCIQPNLVPTTIYRFKKIFRTIATPLERHYYCSKCFTQLISSSVMCPHCKKRNGVSYFISMSVISQLAKLYQRPGFFESLQHRYTRRKKVDNNLEDIYDGRVYDSLSARGNFLYEKNNISLTWYTDGISIFKSSKFSIWPFFLTINEVPFNSRAKIENTLIAGLWFGSQKPQANIFMNSFRKDLQTLYQGVSFRVDGLDHEIFVRGMIICGTCDLPAKSQFLNMKGHRGTFGCCQCTIKTKFMKKRQSYAYRKNLNIRTSSTTRKQGEKVFRTGKSIQGVKGPTVLSQIVYDFMGTVAVDVMHCVYLGIVKKLMTLWFKPFYRNKPFSLSTYVELIERKIRQITPPCFVPRLPRSLQDFKYWKASEFQQWLLYYSIPILIGIMDEKYLAHHKLLVLGISILSQASVSEEMLDLADRVLNEYVSKFASLYGAWHMTCNLHQLLHLIETVRKFGPLHVTSCFRYEDLNGQLKRLIHGTRYAQLQVCSSIERFSNIAALNSRLLNISDNVKNFCEKLSHPTAQRRKLKRLHSNIFALGKLKFTSSPSNIVREALLVIGIDINDGCYTFDRLYKDKLVYDSVNYQRMRRTNSSVIKYVAKSQISFGIIQTFIEVSHCDCVGFCEICPENCRSYAIVKKCEISDVIISNPIMNLIYLCSPMTSETALTVIPVEEIESPCISVKNNDNADSFFAMDYLSINEHD